MKLSMPLRRILWCAAALALSACSPEKKEPDCVPAPVTEAKAAGGKIESTPLLVESQGKKDNDWCRACIMGPKGYASCQRVYGDTPAEPRDAIRARARAKACVDSGFTAEACPAAAVIGIVCKGDPPPPNSGDPAKILQGMYQQLNPPPVDKGGSSELPPAGGGAKPAIE